MAIGTPTLEATINSGTDATSYTSASVTVAAGDILAAFIFSRVASGTPNEPTATGWSVVASTPITGAGQRGAWYTNGSPVTGTHTFDFAGQTQQFCMAFILKMTGANTATPSANGVNAGVPSGTASSLTYVTPSAGSISLAAIRLNDNINQAPSAANDAWVELADVTVAYEVDRAVGIYYVMTAADGVSEVSTFTTMTGGAHGCEILIAAAGSTITNLIGGKLVHGFLTRSRLVQ